MLFALIFVTGNVEPSIWLISGDCMGWNGLLRNFRLGVVLARCRCRPARYRRLPESRARIEGEKESEGGAETLSGWIVFLLLLLLLRRR